MGLGVFVKEIELQLLDETIDMAVHSLKDVPTELPDGLQISAVLERHDPRDIQTNILGSSLDYLPSGFTLGTSSPRRQPSVSRWSVALVASGLVGAGLSTRWPNWRVPLGGTKSPHLTPQMYPTFSIYSAAPLRSI